MLSVFSGLCKLGVVTFQVRRSQPAVAGPQADSFQGELRQQPQCLPVSTNAKELASTSGVGIAGCVGSVCRARQREVSSSLVVPALPVSGVTAVARSRAGASSGTASGLQGSSSSRARGPRARGGSVATGVLWVS